MVVLSLAAFGVIHYNQSKLQEPDKSVIQRICEISNSVVRNSKSRSDDVFIKSLSEFNNFREDSLLLISDTQPLIFSEFIELYAYATSTREGSRT